MMPTMLRLFVKPPLDPICVLYLSKLVINKAFCVCIVCAKDSKKNELDALIEFGD